MPTFKDITGQQFSYWLIVQCTNRQLGGSWLCRCVCGTERILPAFELKVSRSCGCMRHELIRQARTKHGDNGRQKRTAEYAAWRGMHTRCNNRNNPAYPSYGGRGITVCERWSSYESFLADMGRKPTPKHSLDRIDNDAGYSPENCKWATYGEQNSNQRPRRKGYKHRRHRINSR